MMVRARKGYFFVIDALIAIGLLVILLIAIYKPIPKKSKTFSVYLLSNDLMNYLSNTKIRDLPRDQQDLVINNLSTGDLYISEALGELYWRSSQDPSYLELCRHFLNRTIDNIIDKNYVYRIVIGNSTKKEVLFNNSPYNINDSSILATSKKIVFVIMNRELVDSYVLDVEVGSK